MGSSSHPGLSRTSTLLLTHWPCNITKRPLSNQCMLSLQPSRGGCAGSHEGATFVGGGAASEPVLDCSLSWIGACRKESVHVHIKSQVATTLVALTVRRRLLIVRRSCDPDNVESRPHSF